MRPRVGLVGSFFLVVVVSLAVSSGRARATNCAGVISPCINDDNLWPHAGPALFAAVGSTDTVAANHLGFALVTSYFSRPLVLRLQSPGTTNEEFAVDDQVNGTFLWSYGVSDRLELDLAMPLTFGQSGTGLAPVTGGAGLNDTAVRDMRFGFSYALVHDRSSWKGSVDSAENGNAPRNQWGLAARFEVSAPSGDRDQFSGERSGVFIPSLSTSFRRGRFFAGGELGARIRPTTELLGARIGTQIVTELGVGADILARGMLSATLEGWALPVLSGQDSIVLKNGAFANQSNGRILVPAEWQLSARTAPLGREDLTIELGGGGGLPLGAEGELTPRFRFTLSIRWAPVGERLASPDSSPRSSDAPAAAGARISLAPGRREQF